MDAVDQKLREDKIKAMDFLIIAAAPGGPFKCYCGGPIVRPQDKWANPWLVRRQAFGRLDVGSGTVGLAMMALIDEGIFLTSKRHKIRLNPNFRRTNRFKELIKEGRRFERSIPRRLDS